MVPNNVTIRRPKQQHCYGVESRRGWCALQHFGECDYYQSKPSRTTAKVAPVRLVTPGHGTGGVTKIRNGTRYLPFNNIIYINDTSASCQNWWTPS